MSFVDNIKNNLSNLSKEEEEITLEEFLSLVKEDRRLARKSHKYVLDMIISHGVSVDEEGQKTYNFFQEQLFGVEESIEKIMNYLKAAATGSEVSRRILLLFGPTSSGKSQLAIMLKRGLEAYSKTQDGKMFCISESPMHEDPLCAIPEEYRKQFAEEYGVSISGSLSPYMQLVLDKKYDGNFLKLPVKRLYLSEMTRKGIGTFVPSDKKSQDISELIGSIDLSKIAEYGSESDPRAYKFDGELNVSNRGMMEFVEMLKVDQKFLYVLLTLAQEKNIKTPRFPLIYADEFVLGHTNETEYTRFLGKDEMEAMHDRLIVVKVPYNLKLDSETKIYEKLISQSNIDGKHIAPYSLYVAAMFAVLTRLKESKNNSLTKLKKMRLYNGEEVEGFTSNEVKIFKKEFDHEGMSGISPRYVINRISTTLSNDDQDFVTPIDIIRSIKDGFESNPKLSKKEIDQFDDILTSVIEEYSVIAKNEVQKAFFVNFEKEIENLLNNYMDQVESYLEGTKVEDEWGDLHDPNERLMRSIEEKIKVTASGKKSFRQEIYRKMLKSASNNGGSYNYKEHPKLREALEKQLFDERQDVIRLTVSSRTKDEETLKRINVVIDTLVEKHGYTVGSANELLKYVSSLMARN